MSAFIKVFKPDSFEHKRLEIAAAIMNIKSPNHYKYRVAETYFDYGQDWKWTTILCDNYGHWGEFQALSPRQQEEIILAENVELAVINYFTETNLDKSEL